MKKNKIFCSNCNRIIVKSDKDENLLRNLIDVSICPICKSSDLRLNPFPSAGNMTTLSKSFDHLIGGGIPISSLTYIISKGNLSSIIARYLSVVSTLPVKHGGLDTTALYITGRHNSQIYERDTLKKFQRLSKKMNLNINIKDEQERLNFMGLSASSKNVIEKISDNIQEEEIKFLVIDTLPIFASIFKVSEKDYEESIIRSMIGKIGNIIQNYNTTVILTETVNKDIFNNNFLDKRRYMILEDYSNIFLQLIKKKENELKIRERKRGAQGQIEFNNELIY